MNWAMNIWGELGSEVWMNYMSVVEIWVNSSIHFLLSPKQIQINGPLSAVNVLDCTPLLVSFCTGGCVIYIHNTVWNSGDVDVS